MAIVRVKNRDQFEEALTRFVTKCKEEKILSEAKRRTGFVTEREKRTAKQRNSYRRLHKN